MRTSQLRLDLIKKCMESASKDFPTEFGVINQLDRITYEIMKKISEVKSQNHAQRANVALIILSYRTLHCVLNDLEEGYYEIAMTLLRRVYENYIQMNYFATYPEAAKQWLEEEKKFKQSEMRKKLGISNSLYDMLSTNFAHSLKIESITPLVFDKVEDKLSLNHYPVYSYWDCRNCLFAWIIFANNTIHKVQRVFKAEHITDKRWMKK